MCGITGFYNKSFYKNNLELLEKMSNSLKKRGPDYSGSWYDNSQGIYLSHRRLSILDLSKNGNQPMISMCGRFVISFNGEIYNFKELRKKLQKKGYTFKGFSDTEVILGCFHFYGIKKSLEYLEGMFAAAIWDKSNKKLSLVRDRLGEKPLYYGSIKNGYVFSSELKSIKIYAESKLNISNKSVDLFFFLGFIPAPHSIFENIYKVEPGEIVEIFENKIVKIKYWSLKQRFNAKKSMRKQKQDFENCTNIVHKKLNNCIKKTMVSDVEIGSFLSGGIDSSLITALMQENSLKKIKTYTIGFNESEFDESKYAKKIADILGTQHHEEIFSVKDLMSSLEDVLAISDEPFGDSSILPTNLVSKLASKDLKVILSGDGGDEVFFGYNRYLLSKKLMSISKFFGHKKFNYLHKLVNFLPLRFLEILSRPIQKKFGIQAFEQKIDKVLNVLKTEKFQDFNKNILMNFDIFQGQKRDYIDFFFQDNDESSVIDVCRKNDLFLYLPNDILYKVDTASMFNSLEVRSPFLNHKIIEQIFETPSKFHCNGKDTKIMLKKILNKYLPEKYYKRPKMGFAIPIEKWCYDRLFMKKAESSIREIPWREFGFEGSKFIKDIKNVKYPFNLPVRKLWLFIVFSHWHLNYQNEK